MPEWLLKLLGTYKAPIKLRNSKTDRKLSNLSKTKSMSLQYENMMYDYYPKGYSGYDIPYIDSKKIRIGNYTTSTNALDSLVKYAGMHNRNLKLAERPLKGAKTRLISKEEAIGLSGKETNFGALSYISEPNIILAAKNHNRTPEQTKQAIRGFYNANVFTAFLNVPAVTLVNNYHYNQNKDKSVPPLLDAFRYYAEGDYNRGDKNHTQKVKDAGATYFQNPDVLKWWKESGKDYFEGRRK